MKVSDSTDNYYDFVCFLHRYLTTPIQHSLPGNRYKDNNLSVILKMI